MKPKLLQLFSGVIVMAVLLSGCVRGQSESSSEAPALFGSETTQAADDSSISDMGFDTEKASSTISNESSSLVSQQNDNSTTEENTVEKMILQIGNDTFTSTLENNDAVDALVDMMREASVRWEQACQPAINKRLHSQAILFYITGPRSLFSTDPIRGAIQGLAR